MAFPTLSRRSVSEEFTYAENTIKNTSEAGYDVRRPRFTRNTKVFTIKYSGPLPTADRDLLISHYESVGTHTTFNWTDKDNNTYVVYYNKPVKFTLFIPGWYNVEAIELKEI